VNSQGISIAEISAISNAQLESIIHIKVSCTKKDEVDTLITNLHKVPQVYYVEREIR